MLPRRRARRAAAVPAQRQVHTHLRLRGRPLLQPARRQVPELRTKRYDPQRRLQFRARRAGTMMVFLSYHCFVESKTCVLLYLVATLIFAKVFGWNYLS